MSEAHARPAHTLVGRTGYAVRASLGRTDARAVFGLTTIGYLLAYLYGLGHLAPGHGGYSFTIVPEATSRFFQPALGPFSFEPVAIVSVGPITYLFSFNTVLGLGLALLVGVNLAVTYLVWRQPKACGIGSRSAGAFASIPALLSGTACCGPVILLVLGVQASSAVMTTFEVLLPIAALLLVGSLLVVGRQVQPEAIRAADAP